MSGLLTRRAFLAVGAVAVGAAAGLKRIAGTASGRERPGDQQIMLGGLTLVVRADPWRMSLLDSNGQTLWDEVDGQTIGYTTTDGDERRARRLASFNLVSSDVVQFVAETDDSGGGAISIEVRTLSTGALRMTMIPDTAASIASVGGAYTSPPTERFVGLGERFDGVNQRGKT
ncbi:MAG TPA: hypothetical protein VGF29_17350, partial [Hyphomicrobiaceae bacterium]